MITCANVLSEQRLRTVAELIPNLTWRDGARTAGPEAARVKANEQADLSQGAGATLSALLTKAIEAHPVFRAAALPRRLTPVMVSRTRPGGGYGAHTDNALMGTGDAAVRTDLAFTLFLNDPSDYVGGRLTVSRDGGADVAEGRSGDLALYACGRVHAVTPVESGERLVCVGWVESRVRRADQRAVLFDLASLKTDLSGRDALTEAERLTLDTAHGALLRMWATS